MAVVCTRRMPPNAVHNRCSCRNIRLWTGAGSLIQMAGVIEVRSSRERGRGRGRGMANFIWYVLLSTSMAVIAVGAVWFVRGYLNGTPPRISFFGPKAEPRLAVVDHANVDGRRRLVLVRRDNIEHLIMTGGPVDVVIETGIPARPVAAHVEELEAPSSVAQPVLPAQPVFSRAPRTLGTAAAGKEGAAG